LGRQSLRRFDVFRLRALVATAEQDDDCATPFQEVDPVAWPMVDPQFTYPLPYRFYVSGIPECQAIEARCNKSIHPFVLETRAPLQKRLSLPEVDHLMM
jgi:hypothetical protein